MTSTLLLECVQTFFQRHALLGQPGVVAVSGGPDSVALAHLLVQLLRDRAFPKLVLAHLNHQLRGSASDVDEAFVRKLVTEWQVAGLTCVTAQVHVASLAAADQDNLENTARRARYAWLTRIAQEEKAAWVAVGHSADDQAETVLFRLLRGSGLHGLAGMRERRPLTDGIDLARPVLSVRRADLLAYLAEQRQDFCVDASNLERRFSRNRIRHELLPLLEQDYQPHIVEVLNRLAQQARAVDDVVRGEAEKLLTAAELPRAGDLIILHIARLASASCNLQREVARQVWLREGWPQGAMTFAHWDRFPRLLRGEETASDFPAGLTARRVGNVLQVGPAKKASVEA